MLAMVVREMAEVGLLCAGVPDQSWDESAPAGAGFGQDAPAPPAADDWGSAPATGAAGQLLLHCTLRICEKVSQTTCSSLARLQKHWVFWSTLLLWSFAVADQPS